MKLSGSVGRWARLWSGRDQVQMSVSVQANFYIPHAAKTKFSSSKKIHGNLSQSLLHRPQCPRPPSRSANIQTECANVVRNAEPFENNLTRTIDKELSAVPENILFSHPLWEVLYTELFLNLKWVSLCATKLMEERISERLRKKCSYAITSTRKWQIKVLIAHTPTSNQTNSRGSCVPF